MIPIFNSLTAALAAALFVATVLLVTKKRLKEEFALVWLAASIVVMASRSSHESLDRLPNRLDSVVIIRVL